MSTTTTVPTISASGPALVPVATPPSAPTGAFCSGLPLFRLSVSQFDRMVVAGILTENDRVELIDGLLVAKMSKNPPHRVATRKTVQALERTISPEWHAAKEESLQLGAQSKPEPDVAVVRAELEFDATRDATAADCSLVVEVSDTTLDYDRAIKLRAYANAGIAVYWIVNLVDRQVEVYSGPGPDGYQSSHVYKPGQEVPVVIDGNEVGRIAVADLLP